jgi:hypothetical protein
MNLNKEKMDFILFIAQVLSLISLIVYVIKTWYMASATRKSAEAAEKTLQEMKEVRDQETAPYVIVYLDSPYGTSFIYLIVKNTGRTIAKNVRIAFNPSLRSSSNDIFDEMPMIKHGIASLAPGQELRTFFDSAISYYGREDLPLHITARISYCGGLKAGERSYEQTLDLQAFRDLLYTVEKGMNDLVRQVEEVAKSASKSHSDLQQIAQTLLEGMGLERAPQKKYGWRPGSSKRV